MTQKQGSKSRVEKFKKIIKTLPRVWKLLQDKRVALKSKAIFIGISLVYFIVPYDLIPDVPFVGHVDDFVIFIFLVNWFLKQIPKDILEEYGIKD